MASENHSLPAPVSASSRMLTSVAANRRRRAMTLATWASPESRSSKLACGNVCVGASGLAAAGFVAVGVTGALARVARSGGAAEVSSRAAAA